MELTEAQRDEMGRELSTPSGLVEGVCELGGEPVVLEPWQRQFCDMGSRKAIWNKARQVGWSFAAAARAWGLCYLSAPGKYLGVFVSYNLEDAKEKIRYVKALDDSLPAGDRLERVVWSKTEIEFGNGNRIVTMFRPRGKGPADVYIDELAHMVEDREVMRAAPPMNARGGGTYVGSSPLTKLGAFGDIWSGADGKFKTYQRIEIPWWRSAVLCVDVAGACVGYCARGMATEERVERFGTDALREIFDGMFLEDFETEFECKWSNESVAFLSWELILACSPVGEDGPVVKLVESPVTTFSEAMEAAWSLRGLGDVYIGADIGRRLDATEIVAGERIGSSSKFEERLKVTLVKCKFAKQEAVLDRLCSLPNVRKVTIDQNGIGAQLSETLADKYRGKVIAQVISPKSKPQIANHFRVVLENGDYQFYADGETRRQFHSVKKVVTAAGNVIYDVSRNEKHHADKFWATALMLWGASSAVRGQAPSIILLGDDDDDDRLPGSIFHNFG